MLGEITLTPYWRSDPVEMEIGKGDRILQRAHGTVLIMMAIFVTLIWALLRRLSRKVGVAIEGDYLGWGFRDQAISIDVGRIQTAFARV